MIVVPVSGWAILRFALSNLDVVVMLRSLGGRAFLFVIQGLGVKFYKIILINMTGDNAMKEIQKEILPAALGFLCLFIAEIINTLGIVHPNQRNDFQTIMNILLLMIGAYSFLKAVIRTKNSRDGIQIHYICNTLIIICAFVLNIDVFEKKIQHFSELLKDWHILWLLWSGMLIIYFSNILRKSAELVSKVSHGLSGKIGNYVDGIEKLAEKTHKGTLFAVIIGVFVWLGYLVIGYKGGHVSWSEIPQKSVLIWFAWMIIYGLLHVFLIVIPGLGKSVNQLNISQIWKYSLILMLVAVLIFISIQILPSLHEVFGIILSYVVLVSTVLIAVFFLGKKVLSKSQHMNIYWTDICVFLGIVLFVTFVLCPILGAATTEGESGLTSDNIEYFTKFIELFTAGLELIGRLI